MFTLWLITNVISSQERVTYCRMPSCQILAMRLGYNVLLFLVITFCWYTWLTSSLHHIFKQVPYFLNWPCGTIPIPKKVAKVFKIDCACKFLTNIQGLYIVVNNSCYFHAKWISWNSLVFKPKSLPKIFFNESQNHQCDPTIRNIIITRKTQIQHMYVNFTQDLIILITNQIP